MWRERERQRQRQRQTDRETDRQRQTDRQTETERDREAGKGKKDAEKEIGEKGEVLIPRRCPWPSRVLVLIMASVSKGRGPLPTASSCPLFHIHTYIHTYIHTCRHTGRRDRYTIEHPGAMRQRFPPSRLHVHEEVAGCGEGWVCR